MQEPDENSEADATDRDDIEWARAELRRRSARSSQALLARTLGMSETTLSRFLKRLTDLSGANREAVFAYLERPSASGASTSAGRARLTTGAPDTATDRQPHRTYYDGLFDMAERLNAAVGSALREARLARERGEALPMPQDLVAGSPTPASRALAAARAVHPEQHPEPEVDRQTGEAG